MSDDSKYSLPFGADSYVSNPNQAEPVTTTDEVTEILSAGVWVMTLTVLPGISYITLGAPVWTEMSYSAASGKKTYTLDSSNYLAMYGKQYPPDPNYSFDDDAKVPVIGKVTITGALDMLPFDVGTPARVRMKANPALTTQKEASDSIWSDIVAGTIATVRMTGENILGQLSVTGSSAALTCALADGSPVPFAFFYKQLVTNAKDLLPDWLPENTWVKQAVARQFLDLLVPAGGDSHNALPSGAETGVLTCTFLDAARQPIRADVPLNMVPGGHRFVFCMRAGAKYVSLSMKVGEGSVPLAHGAATGGDPNADPADPLVITLAPSTPTYQLILGPPSATLSAAATLYSPIADHSGANNSTQEFAFGETYRPAETNGDTPVLAIFHDAAARFGRTLNVTLDVTRRPAQVTWTVKSVPPQSASSQGTLSSNPDGSAVFSIAPTGGLPIVGGLYTFHCAIRGTTADLFLVLPLAGAEIKSVVEKDYKRSSKYIEYVREHNNGNADFAGVGYAGRPDTSPVTAVRRYSPLDQNSEGCCVTWFGCAVNLMRATDFIKGYVLGQLSSDLEPKPGPTLDAADLAWNAGLAVARGDDYEATVTEALPHIVAAEPESRYRQVWPNSAEATNYMKAIWFVDPENTFTSPGFLGDSK